MSDTGEMTVQEPCLRLLGHLAGRGDVSVEASEWLGGPHAPARIEGLAIELEAANPGWRFEYAVQLAGPGGPRSGPRQAGQFAGARGRLLPITSVAFRIAVPADQNAELVAEALFLGSPIRRLRGTRVVLTGPTGSEPLVGLRLGLSSRAPGQAPQD